jgi:hypothetical protein
MSEFDRFTDTELIEAFRAGDSDAFAALYDRYTDFIFTAYLGSGRERLEAAEATHDIFLEAAGQILGANPPENFEGWLTRVGRREAFTGTDAGAKAPPALRARVLTKVDALVLAESAAPAPSRSISRVEFPSSLPPEWRRMGLFFAVTIVIGLLGFAVSAQFQPHQPPPTMGGDGTSPRTTTIPATTSTTIGVTSTTVVTDTTATTAASGTASLEVSTDTVDFGDQGTSAELGIINRGGNATSWTLASSSDALAVSAGSGELAGGETVTIELLLDRNGIDEGDLEETLTLSWPDGDLEVAVLATHEDNPTIHNPQASPATVEVEGCDVTTTTVSARVRDTSPLESVVVRWSPDGSGQRETAMEPVGDDMFEGIIGPFTATGTFDVRIVAFDERGNAGGASTPVSVTDCS